MSMSNEPFNRALPSPIAAVQSMLSSSSESVAVASKLTPQQGRVAINDGIADRILERLGEDRRLDLILISGSAGDGKSFTLGSILARQTNPWKAHAHRVIEDATHSERPDQLQRDRLNEFFAPLRAGEPPLEGPPLIIAANTGLLIRFFEGLRAVGEFEPYRLLADVLFHALRIPDRERGEPDPEVASRILVINLDERVTTGGDKSFFAEILRAFDPAVPGGVMGGAARCETCAVQEWCWVRSNAEVISSQNAIDAIDRAAHEVALIRGRSINPRALWDAAAAITLGGATFSEEDPCDDIAVTSANRNWIRLWNHTIPNGVFHLAAAPGLTGELKDRDPTFWPDKGTHDAIANAGIDKSQDAKTLLEKLGASDESSRFAIGTLARALASGDLVAAITEERARQEIPRALARARWLAGATFDTDPQLELFSRALEQYAESGAGSLVDKVEELIGDALVWSFGQSIGGEHFFRTGRQDGRDVAVYVKVAVSPGTSHEIQPDPVLASNPDGAMVTGYKPLAFPVQIGDVDVTLTYGLFRVLHQAQSGTLPSAKELERFYSLGRAVTALGNREALDHNNAIVIADRRGTGRRIRIEQVKRRGSRWFREQEVI